MKSVVFEESMLNDPRFIALTSIVKSKQKAIGMLIEARFLDHFYTSEKSQDIPINIWKEYDLDPMLEVLLAVVGPSKGVFLDYSFEVKNG